ncbi:unnamed protein product, partial [Rotaria magnacalcarata]
ALSSSSSSKLNTNIRRKQKVGEDLVDEAFELLEGHKQLMAAARGSSHHLDRVAHL